MKKPDGGYEEAKIEGRRLIRLWSAGRCDDVISSLSAAKAGAWFVAMTVAIMCDGLDIGEREDLIARMRAKDVR